jgi:RimJ/RimL family protein N-acetyltransferase
VSGGVPVLVTERLILRTWADGDAAEIERHCNSPAVMRWTGDPQQGIDEIEAGIARSRALQAEHGFCYWALERKADGAFLGFCGLRLSTAPFALNGAVEIGWRLREDVWGQGYAREAAEASLDHAFRALNAERVVSLTVAQNEASWGLMERLGMRRRVDLDHHDPAYSDELNPTIVYVIECAQWRP